MIRAEAVEELLRKATSVEVRLGEAASCDALRQVLPDVVAAGAFDAHLLGLKTPFDVGRVICRHIDAFLEEKTAELLQEAKAQVAALREQQATSK